MKTSKRLVGIILIAIGAIVAVHTIVEPLYHVSSGTYPYSPLWSAINPLTALAIVLGVICARVRKKACDTADGNAAVTREFLAALVQLYGFLFVGILFFWNWFGLLMSGFTGAGTDTVSMTWILIDASVPLLAVSLGILHVQGENPSQAPRTSG